MKTSKVRARRARWTEALARSRHWAQETTLG